MEQHQQHPCRLRTKCVERRMESRVLLKGAGGVGTRNNTSAREVGVVKEILAKIHLSFGPWRSLFLLSFFGFTVSFSPTYVFLFWLVLFCSCLSCFDSCFPVLFFSCSALFCFVLSVNQSVCLSARQQSKALPCWLRITILPIEMCV